MSITNSIFRHSFNLNGPEVDANLDKLRLLVPYTNVKDFSAAGDGATDDGTAIQFALDALNTAGGGLLYFPQGTYVSGQRLIVYSNTYILGEARGAVTIKAGSSLSNRLITNSQWNVGLSQDTNIFLENIVFDMNQREAAPTFSYVDNFVVKDCRFYNDYGTVLLLTGSPDTSINTHCIFLNVEFDSSAQTQSSVDCCDIGSGSDIHLENCYIHGAKTGSSNPMLSIAIINGYYQRNCLFDGEDDGVPMNIFGIKSGEISHCEFKNSSGNAMRLETWTEVAPKKQLEDFDIRNNLIHDNAGAGIWLKQTLVETDVLKNIRIYGNSIYNNDEQAVECGIVNGLKIFGNDIYNNSLASAGTHPVFDFNGGLAGVAHVKNISVFGNRIYDDQGTPTQTTLYNCDWVDNLYHYDNQVSQITSILTESNSSNIFLMGRRLSQTYTFTFTVAAGQTNKFIARLASANSRQTDFYVQRIAVALENSTGAGQTLALAVLNGSSTMTATASNSTQASTTTNAFLWDISAQDLTVRYTSSAGCATGEAVATVTGFDYETP